MSRNGGKLRLAVFKFSSCSGCQDELINLGEDLLSIIEKVEIAYFLEASSRIDPGPYDVALIEGSIPTPHEMEVVKSIRRNSKIVIPIGTCAVHGGPQSLRNWMDHGDVVRQVYPRPEWINSLDKTTPISEHIKVDYQVSGCPVNRLQLLSVLKQVLVGKRPYHRLESLCQECKRRGNVCVMVSRGTPCLGPIMVEGCGALCPSYARGCYGCFGPMIDPKPEALARGFEEIGLPREEVILKLRNFSSWSEPLRRFLERYERG
ncbi:MAG: oxidoreductase [Nitrososphaerota archaeon]